MTAPPSSVLEKSSIRDNGSPACDLRSGSENVFSPKVVDQQRLDSDFSQRVSVSGEFPDEFCWDGRGYELADGYVELMRRVGVDDDELRCRFDGYAEYSHAEGSECPVETVYKPMLDVGKYHIQRSYQHRSRSADRAIDRYAHLKDRVEAQHKRMDYFIFIDLTTPRWVSEQLRDPKRREKLREDMRSAVGEFYRRLYGEMFPDGDGEFAPMRTIHIWSSEQPFKPHLHAHTVMPNVAVETIKTAWPHSGQREDGTGCPDVEHEHFVYHRFRPYVPEDTIKEVWRSVLEDYGLWSGSGLPVAYVTVIRFRGVGRVATKRAKEDNARIHHKFSYMARLPLEDINEYLEGSGNPDDFDLEWFEYLKDYTTYRANLGFIHNLKRVGYDSNKSIPVRCPLCEAKMFYEGKHYTNFPDKIHLVRDNNGKWKSIPPPPDIEIDLSGIEGGEVEPKARLCSSYRKSGRGGS